MRLANLQLIPIAALLVAASRPAAVSAQTPSVVGHSVDVSRARAELELQLSNNEVVNVALAGGQVLVNGTPSAPYAPGGTLDVAWRALLDSAAAMNTSALMAAIKRWPARPGAGPEAESRRTLLAAITNLAAVPPAAVSALPPAPPEQENVAVQQAEDLAPPVDFNPEPSRSSFAGVGPMVAGLFGSFVALACIAFGLVSFAPRQLDVVSDTVQRSFLRSFLAGLFAQPLILPALATLIVALVLTVVGILVIPVAIIGFFVALTVGVIGGYIATARALGDIYMRRKMARGIAVSADPTYRSIIIGLTGLLLIWAPFALLGWVPGFGTVLLGAAVIFTWIMATVGLGATILSRAGLRSGFGRKMTPQLSGELSWSTVDEIAPSRRGEGSVP